MSAEMTAAKARALRKAFPTAAVGKLPKPYKADSQRGNCKECGGYHGLPAVHLDYVGHAATTDRLLSVDPEWTWRPFTQDELMCLPPKLRDAGLWIHLTVCGVTRPGVGDGKSAKECIGDAIRNAAMRFGVALDLWAKEDLHEIQAAQKGEPSAYDEAPPVLRPRQSPPPVERPTPPPATKEPLLLNPASKLAKAMYAGLRDAEAAGAITDPKAFMSEVVGREIASSKELTEDEARRVLDHLPAQIPTGADA